MRKNNTGKAILRFLIGAVLLAAVVVVLLRFVLPNDQTAPLTEVDKTQTAHTDPVTEVDKTQTAYTDPVTPGTDANIPGEPENTPVPFVDTNDSDISDEPEDTEPGTFDLFTDEPEDLFDEPYTGEEITGDDVTEDEPEDEPEVEPVVTPVPVVTPAPIASADCNSAVAAAQKYPWKSDRATRVKNGITQFETLTSDKGGSVIKITGWSYGNWEGFNGKNNTTYVSVTNEKKETKYYDVTVVSGISGITHTIKHGRNMELADFTCMIDVSDYPDGTYSLGSANRFKVDKNTYSFAYTYGEAYTITVVSGIVTARGGVEN